MRIGFIGLGDMGMPMARRLISLNLPIAVWNRTPDKLDQICREGAERAASPAELVRSVELIGICVTSHEAVREIASGPRGLFSEALASPRVIADFSTGSPAVAIELATEAATCNIQWVDIPVSGGVRGAAEGRLVGFAGGRTEAIASLQPMLTALFQRVTHMGSSGQGQVAKLCNQMIVAAAMSIIAESMQVAKQSGLDARALPEAFQGGFADSLPLQIFGPRMASGEFAPRLGAISLMKKDVMLARQVARSVNSPTPLLNLLAKVYEDACSNPDIGPDADLSALIKLLTPPPKLPTR
jgi:3-hydroxyisobutyrate dehydrogenase